MTSKDRIILFYEIQMLKDLLKNHIITEKEYKGIKEIAESQANMMQEAA